MLIDFNKQSLPLSKNELTVNLIKTTYRLTLLIILLSACGGRYKEAAELYDRAARLEENGHPDSALIVCLQSLELLGGSDEYELMK